MKPVYFPKSNIIFAKDQPEYLPLPAHKDRDGAVTTCWTLSFRERLKVFRTGRVWLTLLAFGNRLIESSVPAGKESEGLENWEPDMEGIGGWTRNPAPSPGPSLSDLRGIAPNATGGLSSEEFVRRIREGWMPPWKSSPIPKEVEEAMEFLGFWRTHLMLGPEDRFNDPYVWDDRDQAALAVIRAALRTKVVSRDELRLFFHKADLDVTATKAEVVAKLRDLGVEVRP